MLTNRSGGTDDGYTRGLGREWFVCRIVLLEQTEGEGESYIHFILAI